jgi:hypothetical protein
MKMNYYGNLKLFIDKKYLIGKVLLTKRTPTLIKGPLYHITTCLNNSTNYPTHNWISLIYYDSDCPFVTDTGAIANIVTSEYPLSVKSDTLAVIIDTESFKYISESNIESVEIYDDSLIFFKGIDYVKLLFIGILLLYILFKFFDWLNHLCKTQKIKSKKYTSDEELHCSICIEDVTKDEYYKQLPCTHKFHTKCIDEWLERKKICPNCNTPSDVNEPLLIN